MLQIKNISKQYKTGELVQKALDDVSLNFRDNEFVAILGPSGSGKTTLLNIVGGLDRYDSGDLIINGISTKKYKDRDWDSYRNHTIGFVFQSYNLIPHQNILSNVELALTISGISKSERRKRAKQALEKVGLGDQLHKRPNQMSGGQMQRVAIARALVNDPDILLADEPTGALDSETSIQVMNLLNEVAKDRLVIMVTHNPELAEKYANRIVNLADGKITGDSNPFEVVETDKEPEHKNMGRSSMSFLTALALSFNNLRTKKGRTVLTSFAGSIGIIGIALILSISNGVNIYIDTIQRNTMTSYPIQINAKTIDLSSMIAARQKATDPDEVTHDMNAVYSDNSQLEAVSKMSTSFTENNLTDFKKYLDDPKSEIHKYVGDNGIVYSYATKFDVYSYDSNDTLVNADGSTLQDQKTQTISFGGMEFGTTEGAMRMIGGGSSLFEEILPDVDNKTVGTAVKENYDLIYGEYPQEYNELVLVLDGNNEIPVTALYQLGFLPVDDYKKIAKKIEKGEDVELDEHKLSYSDICAKEFYLMPYCDYYVKNRFGTYDNISEDEEKIEKKLKNAVVLRISGIIRQKKDSDNMLFTQPLAYTKLLTEYLMDYTDNSSIVKEQRKDENTNVITGMTFEPKDDSQKAKDAKKYLEQLSADEKSEMYSAFMAMMGGMSKIPQTSEVSEQSESTGKLSFSQLLKMKKAQTSDNTSEGGMSKMFDEYLRNADEKTLVSIYDNYISTGSYKDNLSKMGVVSEDAPSSISIYADSFENKDFISQCIEDYNKNVEEENKITYTDFVGLLMSSVTTIVNVISYVLIAFVAVSLIVSSIMIGIITYISVLERTKEIGILRAIGASKRNISQVFNAETFIIGLFSGLMGIGITLLLLIPINEAVHALTEKTNINAVLPLNGAVILIILSVILTLIGGLIPSKKAAKKDPVTALRTE